jgi:tRNA(fMet)-specific endonuclease VapC
MPPRYLLDTNTASYAIKGTIPRVRERLQKTASSDISISAVTEAELRFGLAKYPEATRLKIVVEEFLRFAEIRSWDSDAARHYAVVRAAAEREGRPSGSLDMMIAAHALALGAVLVTGDRVFRRVAGLKIEDWSKST